MHVSTASPLLQAIALLDTLDKDVNTFVMRVREWYSWHFPELVKARPTAVIVLHEAHESSLSGGLDVPAFADLVPTAATNGSVQGLLRLAGSCPSACELRLCHPHVSDPSPRPCPDSLDLPLS